MKVLACASCFFATGWIFNGLLFIAQFDMWLYGLWNMIPAVAFLSFYAHGVLRDAASSSSSESK